METFSSNDKVIIYPTPLGWRKILAIQQTNYDLSDYDTMVKFFDDRYSRDGGYIDMLWKIISELNTMFFNGQKYFKNTNITFHRFCKHCGDGNILLQGTCKYCDKTYTWKH